MKRVAVTCPYCGERVHVKSRVKVGTRVGCSHCKCGFRIRTNNGRGKIEVSK